MSGVREKKRQEEQGTAAWMSVMLDLLRGGALGTAVSVLTLAVLALLVSGGMMSIAMGEHAVVGACLLGGLAGGIFAAARRKSGALPIGVCAGAVMFLLLLTAGTVMYGTAPGVGEMGTVGGACLCGGGVAGTLMSRPKKRKRR